MPLRCRLLALAPNAWDGQWMNRQQILSRLARRHSVIYTTGPFTIWDRSLDSYKEAPLFGGYGFRDGVWIDCAPKVLLGWPTYHGYDHMVSRLMARRWTVKLNTLGTGPIVVYVTHPAYRRYVRWIPRDLLIYSPYDMFRVAPNWTADLALDEQFLLEACDLTIASSAPTRDALSKLTCRDVVCVPNGVDPDVFVPNRTGDAPADIAGLSQPRIGYVGSLNQKVDFPLIARLASQEPGWNFILVGPMGLLDDITDAAVAECKQRPNVHFLGPKDRHVLPAYVSALDVGLMCYRAGTWADYGYPLKLNEYLACGLPVVSSHLPAIQHVFDLIDVVHTDSEWHSAIRRVLQDNGRGLPEARRAFAIQNSWDQRVATINDKLAELLTDQGGDSPSRRAESGTDGRAGLPRPPPTARASNSAP